MNEDDWHYDSLEVAQEIANYTIGFCNSELVCLYPKGRVWISTFNDPFRRQSFEIGQRCPSAG